MLLSESQASLLPQPPLCWDARSDIVCYHTRLPWYCAVLCFAWYWVLLYSLADLMLCSPGWPRAHSNLPSSTSRAYRFLAAVIVISTEDQVLPCPYTLSSVLGTELRDLTMQDSSLPLTCILNSFSYFILRQGLTKLPGLHLPILRHYF